MGWHKTKASLITYIILAFMSAFFANRFSMYIYLEYVS